MPATLPPRYRLPLLVLGLLALLSGVNGGLLRLGVTTPLSDGAGAGAAIAGHGVLMVAAFFGTVISLERAVALVHPGWYLAPLSAGLGGLTLLAGTHAPSGLPALLFVLAALIFCAGSLRIWQRQNALFTLTLGLGAANWLVGNLFWAAGQSPEAVFWWMNFLVLTIAGERLELTRLRPPQPLAARGFAALLVLIHGATLLLSLTGESRPFAAALLLLAAWLLRYDIAWTTVSGNGLPRFVATCLLSGYVQLGVGALLGLTGAFLPGHGWRDAALHAVFLGFVIAMVVGHAPIIFPAVMRVRIPYHPMFYLPLLVLQTSVLTRVAGVLGDDLTLRQHSALGNALALALLVGVILLRVLAGSRQSVSSTPP